MGTSFRYKHFWPGPAHHDSDRFSKVDGFARGGCDRQPGPCRVEYRVCVRRCVHHAANALVSPALQLQAPGLRDGGAGRPRPAVLRPRGPGTVGSGFCRPSVLVYRELGGSTGSAEQAPHQGQPPSLVGPAPWAAVASHSPPTDSQAEGRQLDLASQRPGASQRARSAPPWPALWAQDPGRRQGIDQTRQPPSHWRRPEATGRAWPTPRLERSGATP